MLPLLGSLISVYYFDTWRFAHDPFHAVIEAIGGVIAIIIVFLLYINEKESKTFGTKLVWIISGLISMGILDIIHASVLVGKSFVWFHSAATFFGGVFFGLIWLPERICEKLQKLPIFIFCGTIIFTFTYLTFPNLIPDMVVNKEFTLLAESLNIIGGLGFIASCAYFIKNFIKHNYNDDALLDV